VCSSVRMRLARSRPPEVLDRLRRYLLDASGAWDDADDDQRSRLARALFEALLVRDGHVVAVRPRQQFQPYFVLAETQTPTPEEPALSTEVRSGGPEGIRTPDLGLDRAACLAATPRDLGKSHQPELATSKL
jgi:hypothetical protein